MIAKHVGGRYALAMSTRRANSVRQAFTGPTLAALTPAEARAILRVRLAKGDLDRMDKLLSRSSAGTMTETEREEMLGYLQMGNLLALLHSKARLALRRATARPRRKIA